MSAVFSPSLITDHFSPTYDGNGNVSEYLGTGGTIAAHFEYDPFGQVTVNTDSTNRFPIRFSTKWQDFETGLNYYGYRYYDLQQGRWLNKDPLTEAGGINLYGFVRNAASNYVDDLGRKIVIHPKDPSKGLGNKDLDELIKRVKKTYPDFEKLWNALECSDKVHSLNLAPGVKSQVKPKLDWEQAMDGTGTGTWIDVNSDEQKSEDGIHTPESTLVHELSHALDMDKGRLKGFKDLGEGGVRKMEEEAVRAENKYRAAAGEKLRTTYSGKPVTDHSGEPNPWK